MWYPLQTLALATLAVQADCNRCHPDTFDFPSIQGVEWIDTVANTEYNFSRVSVPPGSLAGGTYTIDFCNVTATYKHVGWNDTINVNIWLPFQQNWNSRMWALGGGGYSSSFGSLYLTQAVAKGYAAIVTDSGHTASLETAQSLDWALSSTGNLNLELIEDWGYKALGELATIGKAFTESYYTKKPTYSYFSGCSGGGRQALAIAQRFPEDYDGILAVAPAIDIETFIPAGSWGLQTMRNLKYYPSPCEVNAFTSEAVHACDGLDGLVDGIISQPSLCNFTAQSVVGNTFSCNGTDSVLSAKGAQVVQAVWDGPTSPDGKISSPGVELDAALTTTYITTSCSANGTCTATGTALFDNWIKTLVLKDTSVSLDNMTNDEFFTYLARSERDFSASTGATLLDLSALQKSGTKVVSWQGVADETIPLQVNIDYYKQVLEANPEGVQDYYRFFEAPGVGHCMGGAGPLPTDAFDQLRSWVENGTAPEVLFATNSNGTRPLCPYPSVQKYRGQAGNGTAQFECV